MAITKKTTKVVYPVYGDEGKEVLKYQKLLQKTGSTIQASGKFTVGMTTAIKTFQKKNSLKVTGKLDAATVKALEAFKTVRTVAKKK